jgi:hypothetical protein
MFGRKKIAALEDKIRQLLPGARMLVEVNDQLKEEKQHLEIALRDTEQANERLKSRLKDAERVVIKPPIEWISGEPKDTGWYFVALNHLIHLPIYRPQPYFTIPLPVAVGCVARRETLRDLSGK